MESRTKLNDSTINSKCDYMLNSPRVSMIPPTRCDNLLNQPSNITVKQEFIDKTDDYNDNQSLQIGTGCEAGEKLNINETEIKIEKDYINGCVFESIADREDHSSERISRMNSNKSSYLEENILKCKFCSKIFTEKFNIKRHMRISNKKPTFTCDICKQSFHKKLLLITHILNHTTKDKSTKCGICDKMFTTNGYLKIHRRIHTGEKPFKCETCDYRCTKFSTLVVHNRFHTGKKPHNCDVCNKGFFTATHLKVHKIIHTGEKPFKCNICSKTFTRKFNLKKHIMNIHSF